MISDLPLQMKALQEAMYHGCEAGHVELTLELRQLGVAWTLHCWMTTLGTASDARHHSVVDALLQDFVPSWPDDSAQVNLLRTRMYQAR